MNVALFKEIGFTEREIKVYAALIEIGQSTAGPIAGKAGLSHTKVYETLDRLIHKGLVSYTILSKTKHFQAGDPKEILNILDERKRKILAEIEELELKNRFAKEKQDTAVHEGYNAVNALFNRITQGLRKNDYYYAFALKQDYKDPAAPLFFTNLHRKFVDKKINDRAIAHEDIRKDIKLAYADNTNIKLRFIRRSTPLGIVLVKNKVIQLTWGDLPTAIEITSKQIHKQYLTFFEELWQEARE
jgi:sugar-specific transcriptional regulator TrmB